jgi:uncharacterized protein (UPF0332 family)
MGFDWKEYLILAQFLQGNNGIVYSEEAARRAAVSRAYYAAFCFARNYASNKLGFVPTGTGKDHGLLISWYSVFEKTNPALSGISDNLNELRLWRNTCDYDDKPRIIMNLNLLTKSALDEAREIIDYLNASCWISGHQLL